MKLIQVKILSCFFLLILIASGCSARTNLNPEIPLDEDFEYERDMNIQELTWTGFKSVAACPKGIYFTIADYLMFYDFASGNTVFVCNKPNCLHDKETDQLIGQECNAYLGNASYGGLVNIAPLFYQNGKLYMIQAVIDFETTQIAQHFQLLEIDLDGNNRDVIFTFDNPVNEIILHRGYGYFVTHGKIGKIDLTKKETFELFEWEGIENIGNLFAIEDDLYFSAELANIDSQTYYGALLSYNLNTDKISVISENVGSNVNPIGDHRFAFARNGKTYILDSETGNTEYLSEDAGQVFFTNDYLFVYNGISSQGNTEESLHLSVYNKETLELLAETTLIPGTKICASAAHGNSLYVYYNDPEDYFSTERLYEISYEQKEIVQKIFCEKHPNDNKIQGYRY